jgi:hypothetical protein
MIITGILCVAANVMLFFLLRSAHVWRGDNAHLGWQKGGRPIFNFWDYYWTQRSAVMATLAALCALSGFLFAGFYFFDSVVAVILAPLIGALIGVIASWIPLVWRILAIVAYPLLWLATRIPIIYIMCALILIGIIMMLKKWHDNDLDAQKLRMFIAMAISVLVLGGMAYFPSMPRADTTVTAEAAAPTATVISDALNVRSGPGTGNPVITQVKKGDVLTVTGTVQNGWLPVEFNGKSGFVSADMVRVSSGD